MSRFTAASKFDHGQPARAAVLMVQLGTPKAPRAAEVRRYLRQFLSDPRVVEIPRLPWWFILNGAILPFRPSKSAAKYASIWTDKGSPLLVNTRKQASLLGGYLGNEGLDLELAFAMRYGEPGLPQVLRGLRERNVTRLLVLPMYPQYASSTTATVFDELSRELQGWRNLPELRFVRGFHDHPAYIEALATSIKAQWGNDGPPEMLLMSFHGIPQRSLTAGDPYHCECHATARLLADALKLPDDRWKLSFQSRFGRAQWLQPYTEKTLIALAKAGTKRVDVVCPGFVSDCLETLEEIADEGKQTYLAAGGQEFRYLSALNADPAFIRALVRIVREQLSGWPIPQRGHGQPGAGADDDPALAARKSRALAMGAGS